MTTISGRLIQIGPPINKEFLLVRLVIDGLN
jgi:hypothetical protein